MTYSQNQAKTRFDFAAVEQITANRRRAERRKLRRLRKAKRVLHFIGFLSYWTVFAGITMLVGLAGMILFISLS